ncbi:MAG: chromosome segregation protein SMC [Candidatus Woesearchaeota archaeon]
MTKINRITIHGFKSFAQKTDIPFDDKFNCILGPNGSGKCVTGDTIVQLADNTLIPIKELIEKKSNNKCQIIDDGFIYDGDKTEILCLNTKTYQIENRQIKNFVKRTAPKTLLKIKTRSGREITSTPYHPLFILKEGKIVSARADELEEGKKIAVPRNISINPKTKIFFELLDKIKVEDNLYVPWSEELDTTIKSRKNNLWKILAREADIPHPNLKSFVTDKQAINFSYLVNLLRSLNYDDLEVIKLIPSIKAKVGNKTYPIPWENSPSFARLLGYLLAEGRLSDSNQIWFTNGTEEIIQDYASLMQEVFSERISINEYKPNCWDVIAYSQPLQVILHKFGMRSKTGDKTVSEFYLSKCSNSEYSELLNGLYCGDGYVSKNSIEIITKSKQLAHAVQLILTRLGILYQSREVIKIATNTGFSGVYQEVNIYGQENFALFAQQINLIHPQKQERLIQLIKGIGNPNLDLIDVNLLVKKTAQECGINVKKTKIKFAKIDAYCYNQCTPSRQGVQQLIEEVFLKSNQTQVQSLMQLQKLAYSNVYWDEIVQIEEIIPKEKWVYDLCVDEHHNFIANNIFVHNSNVGDALCFVLGRISAKSMRAEKASNLIFNGGKKKTPATKAYVEIAFDNKTKIFSADNDEIVVNRTIQKNGTSTYRVNGKRHTRSEVVDLLGLAKINPDGYNIILQGDIMRFVDMSPLERRRTIEEISDVAAYEDKKHKANLELTKVEDKLNNASIILKERKVHLKELKKDRDQALEYKEVKDTIDSNKATYLHLQIEERRKIKDKHDEEISGKQEKIDAAEKKIAELKIKVTECKEQISEINKEVEKKGEKEQLQVHSEIEDLKVELAKEKTRISTLKDEINKIKQRKDQFEQELKELEDKVSSSANKQKQGKEDMQKKQQELKKIEEDITAFKKKNKIESSQEIEQELEEKDKLIDQKQEEVQSLRQLQQELLREKDKIEYQLETLDEKIKKVKEVEKENKDQVKILQKNKEDFKAATLRLNHLLDQDSSFAAQLANAKKSLISSQERHADLEAKSTSFRASLANNMAVKHILESKTQGVYGTVAELGQVKKQYALPLERAAGAKMQHIVVEDDTIASECIKLLQRNKLGTASFIPLNKIRHNALSSEDNKYLKVDGVHEFALNLINFKPQFKKAFAYVFGNTLVVENLEVARKVGINKIKMATIDGSIAEASGVMRGGFSKKSLLSFREEDSTEALEKVERELAEAQNVVSAVMDRRDANEQEILSLRNKKAELEGEIIKLEKILHLDTNDLDASNDYKKELQEGLKGVNDKLQDLQKKVGLLNKELAEQKSRKMMLRSEISQLRNPRLLAQLSAFEDSKRDCREAILRLESDLKNSLSQVEELIAPEKVKIIEIMKQHDKEEKEFSLEIGKLSLTVGKREKDLVQKEKDSKEFYSKYHGLFDQREKFNNEINKNENEIEKEREKMRTHERDVNLNSLKNAEVKARLAGLEEEFSRFKNVEILENKTVEQLEAEIKKAETLLSQMSAVNMKALEIYEHIENEFNSLVEKKDGLEKEKIDVLTLMNEIETKKKEHFMKTFNTANENFQRIFESLFKKGKASLVLENPDKPFDDGLSIKVKLTGNRFMDIKSLSGGEKTLTALSFIFAIQEYQPASFYILDEIDAALDKHNSETLSKLIRSYSNGAQYIMISHNDSVISEADTLFGVSMNEGVSKITSLRI